MKLSVLLHTDDYRGDHSADVALAYEADEGETVEELAERLISKPSEYIVIRLVRGVEQ